MNKRPMTDVEMAIARLDYYLSTFGESVDTLDHVHEILADLKEELIDLENKIKCHETESIKAFAYSASLHVNNTKKRLREDIKTIKDNITYLVDSLGYK